jgi:hypothetical protein
MHVFSSMENNLTATIISMENNLTATIIIYYLLMDQINGTQCAKLNLLYLLLKPIFSHNTYCFCVECCVKPNSVVYH